MKKFLSGLLIFLLLFYVVGFFLSGDYEVSRSRVVKADRALVHSYVADLRTWPDWTAWSRDRDPDCEWTYEGPALGKGASHIWDGPELGKGRMVITSESLGSGIEFDLFWGEETVPAKGSISYADVADGLEVTWTMSGSMEGSVGHWMTFVIDGMAGPDFDKGLEGLAKAAETGVLGRIESGVKEMLDGVGQ